MKLVNLFFLLFVTFFTIQCSEEDYTSARGKIFSLEDSTLQIGSFYAIYSNGVTSATVSLSDMPAGSVHAVHLHDGVCGDTIGGHWNRGEDKSFCTELSMGVEWGKPYAGDFGNIYIDNYGNGSLNISTDLWSVGTGDYTDITNKLVIVHALGSDFALECDPTHVPDHPHLNPKIGCGLIEQ